MTVPDIINGCFEGFGSVAAWMNVHRLYRDKKLKGVSALSAAFFLLWGLWNLYYYPHLNQWASLVGAASLVLANAVWVGQMIYYHVKGKHRG